MTAVGEGWRFNKFLFDDPQNFYKTEKVLKVGSIKYHLEIFLEYVVDPPITQAIDWYQDVSGMPTLCLPVEWGGFGQEAWWDMGREDWRIMS